MRNKYLLISINVGAVCLLDSLYKSHLHFYLRVVHRWRLVVRINCLLQNILSVDCILARMATWSADLNLYPCGWGFSLCLRAWVIGVKQAKKWLSFLCLNVYVWPPFLSASWPWGKFWGKIWPPLCVECALCVPPFLNTLSAVLWAIFLLIEQISTVALFFILRLDIAHFALCSEFPFFSSLYG